MNVASLLSGWTLDLFRITLRDGFGIQDRPANSVLNSGYRLYLLLGEHQWCLVLGFCHVTSLSASCFHAVSKEGYGQGHVMSLNLVMHVFDRQSMEVCHLHSKINACRSQTCSLALVKSVSNSQQASRASM